MMLVSWNTTTECNLSCLHCYRNAGYKDENELSPKEGKILLYEIKKAGFETVVLSGGEPLLRKDIFCLIEYGNGIGLRMVMGTNGTLITNDVAKKLKDVKISRVGISIDSTREKSHDYFRKKNGAFRLAVSGIQNCKEENIPFQINTTIMDFNIYEIEEIIDFAEAQGAVSHHIFFLIATGRARQLKTKESYGEILLRILKKKTSIEIRPICAPQFTRIVNKNTPGCLAGISYCCILPSGDVHPCPYLPVNAGNIRETPFSLLWKESPIFLELRGRNYKGKCKDCNYKTICGGCRARVYSLKNDYMESDPWCI